MYAKVIVELTSTCSRDEMDSARTEFEAIINKGKHLRLREEFQGIVLGPGKKLRG